MVIIMVIITVKSVKKIRALGPMTSPWHAQRSAPGKHETCAITDFKFGVANRGASIRIPRDTEKSGKGLKNLVVFGQKRIFLIHNGNQQNAYRCMMVYENIQDYTSK